MSHKHDIFFPDLTIEIASCLSWGHKAGTAVYQWLQTVKWQSPVSSQEDDFGITYLELLFNFVLVTGCMLPVTISKKSSATHFSEFHHPSSAIASKRARSAAAQGVVLIYIIRQLEMLLQVTLIPATRSIGISSLLKLGYNDMHKKTGFKQRPELLYGKETIAMMENFLKEKDPIVDSVDLKYNKNQVDHAHISYFDMVQPEPYAVKRNLINYKKKHKISSTTDRVVWFDEEGIGMQLSCWWYRVVCCNSTLQKVSRHLNFQGSSTLPKVFGGSVMTLESCRGVDGLEKVTPW